LVAYALGYKLQTRTETSLWSSPLSLASTHRS